MGMVKLGHFKTHPQAQFSLHKSSDAGKISVTFGFRAIIGDSKSICPRVKKLGSFIEVKKEKEVPTSVLIHSTTFSLENI
jgi:hypothetical protein